MSVITISREYASLGAEIGQAVADELGYRFIDKEVVAQAAELAGIPEPELAAAYEKRPSFLERFVVLGMAERYADQMAQALRRLAEEGNAVIIGRGAALVIEAAPHVLHVRVLAPFEVRARRVMAAEGLDWHAAVTRTEQRDRTRALLHEVLFGIDWTNPGLYDLLLNTGSMSIEAATRTIVSAARLHSEFPCEERQVVHDARTNPHEWAPFGPTAPW